MFWTCSVPDCVQIGGKIWKIRANFVSFFFTQNYNMASTAPILINLTLTKRRYVKIFCTQLTKILQPIRKAEVEIYWLLSLKNSWHLVAFHEKLACLIPFQYRNGVPNFMKIGQTDFCLKLSDRRTDGRMCSIRKWLIFYFVKIDWNTKDIFGFIKVYRV